MKVTATFDSLEEFEAFIGTKKEVPQKKEVKETFVKEEVKSTPVKEETPQYTLEDVRAKLGQLQKEGKKEAVKALIQSFGAAKLPEISADDYPALMQKAGEL